uniref:Uncharacterized protein n=1 Tax=Junco hyemalis TaxID=40217 RepID=A0A8C5NJ62_JUNHY
MAGAMAAAAGGDSDGESEELVLTPAQLIQSLEQAWLNEKFAPELLESKPEIIECVVEQLDHMVVNIVCVVLESDTVLILLSSVLNIVLDSFTVLGYNKMLK